LLSPVVPGAGDTDTVPAMLTPGEFVISKPAVKMLGEDFLNFLNSGMVQLKQYGGMVYNTPVNTLNQMSNLIKTAPQMPQLATETHAPVDIKLTIGDKAFNMKKIPRNEVSTLVSALKYIERGLK
jgi:hypothetical protein